MKNALRLVFAAALAIALAACSDPAGDDPGNVDPPTGVSGSLAGAVTWSSGTYVSGTVYVPSGAALTVDPGVTVTFASGASLWVEAGGSLSAVGTSPAAGGKIVFRNASSAAWGGIYLDDDAISNAFSYCEVTGVGSDEYAITMDPGSVADIRDCVIHGNGGGGIDARSCGSGTDIMGNRFYDNGGYPLAICDWASADEQNRFAAEGAVADLTDPDNCVIISGDIFQADRYLTITEVPYRFDEDSSVLQDASLYLGPRATLRFGAGAGLTVMAGGFIVAEGSSEEPVVFEGVNSAASWTGIYFEDDSVDNVLSRCVISGVYNNFAVTLDPGAIADIQNCEISGNHAGGIDAWGAAAGTVVSNNVFGDNGENAADGLYDIVYNDSFSPAGNTPASGAAEVTTYNADAD